MKITRDMVAKKAGVSLATVSYVLNDSHYVSPKLKTRVLEAVEELNYHPDMMARSLVKKESRMLTIVSNGLSNPMYGEIVLGFERAVVKRNYSLNICSGNLPMSQYLDVMVSRRIDGVYFASRPNFITKNDLERMFDNGMCVACGNYIFPEEGRINHIDLDYEKAINEGFDYLIGMGHRKILYAYPDIPAENFVNIRLNAVKKRIKRQRDGVQIEIARIDRDGNDDIDTGILCGRQIAQKLQSTAIFCSSDCLAIGVINGLREYGIRCPEDVSVLGMEDVSFGKYFTPALTTFTFDREKFAEDVVEIILKNIKTKQVSNKLIHMDLVERASVKQILFFPVRPGSMKRI